VISAANLVARGSYVQTVQYSIVMVIGLEHAVSGCVVGELEYYFARDYHKTVHCVRYSRLAPAPSVTRPFAFVQRLVPQVSPRLFQFAMALRASAHEPWV